MQVSPCSKRLKVLVNLRYVKCLWVSTCLKLWASKTRRHWELAPSPESAKQPSGTSFSDCVFLALSVHSAALEMELLPLWLCLGFHFLTVEWRTRSGVATAACQRCCKLVSFPGNSELSVVPVLTRFGPFGKLMDCQSWRAGNE